MLSAQIYGMPSDLCDDLFDVSEITASMKEFSRTVVDVFSVKYLREPTLEDFRWIEKKFRIVGFPGCASAVDCAGWYWKNAPKALQGSLRRKDSKPVLRAEVICHLDLRICSLQFSVPGVLNDLNILSVSEHFAKVLSGQFPPVAPQYMVSGGTFGWIYYLADGIYPPWKVFCGKIDDPELDKKRVFLNAQEGVRKCVERVFGVRFTQFKILFVPSKLMSSAEMGFIANACVLIHSMIAEVRCKR